MSSAFPLLRLPRLVLFEVFKSLSIGEKFKLSLCSKKVSTQINNCRLYSQKVLVYLDMYSHKIEVFANGEDKFKIFNWFDNGIKSDQLNKQQYQIDGRTVSGIDYSEEITAFWKNHQEGFLSAIRHLSEMFQCKFSADIGYYKSDSSQLIILKLFELQLEFKRLTIYPDGSKDQDWLWNQISSSFGLVEYLRIFSIGNPGFTQVFTSWPQNVTITNSYWFTLEYLLSCTCTTITLQESRLGNEDLDEVLRNWKAGGFPNLKCLKIYSLYITRIGPTIVNMNLRELDEMVVQTDDGSKKATIRHCFGSVEIYVNPF